VTGTATVHLPRFGLLFVIVLLVGVLVVAVLVVFVVVRLIVELAVEMKFSHRLHHGWCYETGSVAGLILSRLGGGYVDQKWRPHRGQTQN
jgi:hypothetical protein